MTAEPFELVLAAEDDGLPDPPARLSFIITALPEHGTLQDPSFGQISDAPYTLRNDANSILYEPCRYFRGLDEFSFKANDGGQPPAGGDSNTVTVAIEIRDPEIGPSSHYSLFPLFTSKQDCRMQLIYAAQEFGTASWLGGLSFNVKQLPGQAMSAFTLRMQHTSLNEYPSNRDFINAGWTTVYQDTVLISATGWRRFDFQTPFYYNGTGNLLLDISFNNSSYGFSNGHLYGFYATNKDMEQVSNSQHGDPLLWTVSMFGSYLTQNFKPALRLHEYVAGRLRADFDVNCRVEPMDLLLLAEAWLAEPGQGYSDAFDIAEPADLHVNLKDFGVLASEWLDVLE
jgi:hypothetical protein